MAAASAAFPQRARGIAALSWASSVLGIGVSLWLCYRFPGTMAELIYSLPFTHPEMGDWIQVKSKEWGVWLAFYQPISNAPVKVWTLETATSLPWSPLSFLVLVAAARGVRMSVAALLGRWFGRRYEKQVRARPLTWMIVYSITVLVLLWLSSRSFG